MVNMGYGLEDTIVAISTSAGEGGIGIVRLSGRDALSIADKIFRPKDGGLPSEFKSHTTHYGHIVRESGFGVRDSGFGVRDSGFGIRKEEANPERRNKRCDIIDEVLLTVMRSPKSYTKEDIVEINCHGGIVPLKKVLELVLSFKARAAEPGEFTKRAFLNGRIDLAQAESVLAIIRSKTEASLRSAMGQLGGGLSDCIKKIKEELLDLLSGIEASIDFPDEDIETSENRTLGPVLKRIAARIKTLSSSADKGRILTEGVLAVICGRPNVGKSSLMNYFLRKNRVIVSDIPGTTRDAIEEMVNIGGIPFRIVDTAGITDAKDRLAKEGVERSLSYLKAADLVLFLMDRSEPFSEDDKAIMDEINNKKMIAVVNKADLPRRLECGRIKELLCDKEVIEISVKDGKNLETLEDAVSKMAWGGEVSSGHAELVTNARHKILLDEAHASLERAARSHREKLPPEFIALDIKACIDSLGGITGETVDEDMLDRIFAKFCIGK